MKKLMIAATAALWATVGLAAALESANIVGYTTKTSGSDNNFVTIPFTAVGYNTSDIQQIGISDGGAGTIGWGTESFEIWSGVPTVVAGSGFIYCDKSMDPAGEATDYYWADESMTRAAFSVARGQGVVVNCANDLGFTTPGQVNTEEVSFTSVSDNNFTGNPFPTTIDIQNIAIDDGGAGSIGWGTESFELWEGVPTVVAGSGFIYCDKSMDPAGEATTYYWADESMTKATFPIAPNQGVVINCAEGLTITISY